MIRLEHFERSDFNQLIEWIPDESMLITWSGSLFKFPLTTESLEWYIKNTNDLQHSDAFIYKAVDDETGEVVGHISLGNISRKNRSGRITRVLVSHSVRGKGICQSMVKAVLKIGFEDLQLHRISLGVYRTNPSAITCYEKCGFHTEGISRDTLLYQGRFYSIVEMSMLEDEYRHFTAGNYDIN
ncbi:MAG: GNAT family N-acetyltransferase [Chitinophagaceae bacterium]|nr:GNAT family N-acetyltransferase [Chitinophagaceae bacterium]